MPQFLCVFFVSLPCKALGFYIKFASLRRLLNSNYEVIPRYCKTFTKSPNILHHRDNVKITIGIQSPKVQGSFIFSKFSFTRPFGGRFCSCCSTSFELPYNIMGHYIELIAMLIHLFPRKQERESLMFLNLQEVCGLHPRCIAEATATDQTHRKEVPFFSDA